MQILLLLTILSGIALADEYRAGQGFTHLYTKENGEGNTLLTSSYDPSLGIIFKNNVASVNQTGFWLYYSNKDYDPEITGFIQWAHGINYTFNMNSSEISSLRYANNERSFNEDAFTLYDGANFTGQDYYGYGDSDDLGDMDKAASSLIMSGNGAFIFRDDADNWYCFKSETVTDSYKGLIINYGFWPQFSKLDGKVDNQFVSVKYDSSNKCPDQSKIVPSHKLKAVEEYPNGAWGILTN